MNKPEKIIKFSITDDRNPNAPLKERTLMEQTMDVSETVKLLAQFGINRSRESLYSLWKTPYRNISRSWWVDPDKYNLVIDKCTIPRQTVSEAIAHRSVHVTVQPFSRKGW